MTWPPARTRSIPRLTTYRASQSHVIHSCIVRIIFFSNILPWCIRFGSISSFLTAIFTMSMRNCIYYICRGRLGPCNAFCISRIISWLIVIWRWIWPSICISHALAITCIVSSIRNKCSARIVTCLYCDSAFTAWNKRERPPIKYSLYTIQYLSQCTVRYKSTWRFPMRNNRIDHDSLRHAHCKLLCHLKI